MLTQMLVLEDCMIVTNFDVDSGLWDVKCADVLTGKVATAKMNSQELAIINALAIGGEDLSEDIRVPMYKLAEEIVKEWPIECRPFP